MRLAIYRADKNSRKEGFRMYQWVNHEFTTFVGLSPAPAGPSQLLRIDFTSVTLHCAGFQRQSASFLIEFN
jgi:hypothetical protein